MAQTSGASPAAARAPAQAPAPASGDTANPAAPKAPRDSRWGENVEAQAPDPIRVEALSPAWEATARRRGSTFPPPGRRQAPNPTLAPCGGAIMSSVSLFLLTSATHTLPASPPNALDWASPGSAGPHPSGAWTRARSCPTPPQRQSSVQLPAAPQVWDGSRFPPFSEPASRVGTSSLPQALGG